MLFDLKGFFGQVAALDFNPSLFELEDTGDDFQRGGFPGAIWPEQARHHAGTHIERNSMENLPPVISKTEIIDSNGRLHEAAVLSQKWVSNHVDRAQVVQQIVRSKGLLQCPDALPLQTLQHLLRR